MTVSLCYWRIKHRRRLEEKSKSRSKFCGSATVDGRHSSREMTPFGGASSNGPGSGEYQGLLSRDESESLLLSHQHLYSDSSTTGAPHRSQSGHLLGGGGGVGSSPHSDHEMSVAAARASSVPPQNSRPQTASSTSTTGSYPSTVVDAGIKLPHTQPQPDLILSDKSAHHHQPLNPSNLIHLQPSAVSPAPSTVSSVLTNASLAIRRSGTLPSAHCCQTLSRVASQNHHHSSHSHYHLHHHGNHPHHHQTLGRNHVCQHSGPNQGSSATAGVTRNFSSRPGYVTLPRRPHAPSSTSSPPVGLPPTVQIREPIYDGVGPRTSADGSSLSRKNSSTSSSGQAARPLKSSLKKTSSIRPPPPTTPLEASADTQATKSTPNILDRLNGNELYSSINNNHKTNNNSSSSNNTLLDDAVGETMSGYCEPFGKALLPHQKNNTSHRNSLTSGKLPADATSTGQSTQSKTLPRKPSLQRHSDSSGSSLYRPIPPPKPRQRLAPGEVKKQFQDEGEDGSEV